MDKTPAPSLTEATYADLRSRLIAGQFKPNDKLKIADLCQQVSASQSVVREVLSRLASDGLLVAKPQRGFRIAPLQVSDLHYLTQARIEVESLCLRDAMTHGGLPWEAAIVSSLHQLSGTSEATSNQHEYACGDWRATHAAFHRAIVSACTNPRYLKMRDSLYMHSERYRSLAIRFSNTHRDLKSEHAQIAHAVIARDTNLACRLITDHLQRTTMSLLGEPESVP